jgi:DNA-binding transcriptional ArsR family regulator
MAVPDLDVFQVIADPSRREMLHLLSKKTLTINALTENFEMSRPAVSKHVKILYNAGFITMTYTGRECYCALKPDGFKEVQNWVNHFDKFWSSKLQKLDQILKAKKN